MNELPQRRHEMLVLSFLDAMGDICQYGYEKHKEKSFQHQRLLGSHERTGPRVWAESLAEHAYDHFRMYLDGQLHDHFHTRKHQLAAVAVNAMMEYFFADLENEQSEPVDKNEGLR